MLVSLTVPFLSPGQNPGGDDTAFSCKVDDLKEVFQTNLVGPAYVSQAFISLVEKSRKKTIVNVSSTLGSIGSDMGRVFTSYAIVKAGLNMLVRLHLFLSLSF